MARVLIVEPHPDVRESLAAVCETWAHQVVTAADGGEALALGAAFRPEVVLLDLGLAGDLDGAEVAHRMRDLDGDAVYIIALTGWAPVGGRAKVLKDRANAFFLKPPDLDELQKTVALATEQLARRRSS